ncbi:MAG: hypothetical protein II800_02395 [Lachnospiraceae bacterium]|nr:hypothetical protein [Lachnospiraceae bacterium]
MANSVNAVNPQEWDEAKHGLPEKIQVVYDRDAFFLKAQQIGFTDPKLVRALYLISSEDRSVYLELTGITLMNAGEEDTPEKLIDYYCRRMDEHDRRHPTNPIGKKYPEEVGLIIDEWNLQNKDKKDYVKRYRPGEFNPWADAMEHLPPSLGGHRVGDFFREMKDMGLNKEEDIPVISALYEFSGVAEELDIVKLIEEKGVSSFVDGTEAISEILDRAEQPTYRQVFRTHPEQVKTLYDYYNENSGEDLREPAYELDTKNNVLRTTEDMKQIRRLDEHLRKVREESPWIDDLSRRNQYLLYGDHDLDTLAEMFNTKKTLRFFQGGDSQEYKNARDRLNEYLTERDRTKELLKEARAELDQGSLTREAYEAKIKDHLDALRNSERDLRAAMGTYAIKVTNGNLEEGKLGDKRIQNMTATGAARLAGAMCILECFDHADVLRGDRQKFYGEVRDEEHVKEVSFAKLYAQKFGEIKDEKNRHRRAAAYAQQEMKDSGLDKISKDMNLGI